jgi:IS5 family transposase
LGDLSAGRRTERWSLPDAHGTTTGRPLSAGTEESAHVRDRASFADKVTLPPFEGSLLGVTEKLCTAGAAAFTTAALAPAGAAAARAKAVMAAASSGGSDR